jgi:hypothetical protein
LLYNVINTHHLVNNSFTFGEGSLDKSIILAILTISL